MRTFKLYPEERHWWSFNDHEAVITVMERLKPKRVLEFGPGSSTLALIEGGAEHIDCCEDNEHWATVYRERLEARYPSAVTIRPYVWSDPVFIPGIEGFRYDLALIDGPHQTQRDAAIEYCLARCTWVLFPTEEATGNHHLRGAAIAAAARHGRPVEFTTTGPLSGAFALIGPRC